MNRLLCALFILGAFFSQHALAVVVSPQSVVASSTFGSYDLPSLINGNGLTGDLETGLHGIDYPTMWMSDQFDTNAVLTFDMGSEVTITAAHIWQYNATCCGLDRGVQNFSILWSNDNNNFQSLTSGSLTQSAGGQIAAQIVPMSVTARYIRFQITSNYGDNYTGLSEVAFNLDGYVPPEPDMPVEPVPGLTTWTMLLLSLLVLLVAFRRSRST